VVAGKWATAKLILSIAYAQYHPKDPKEKTFKTSDLKFGKLANVSLEYQLLMVIKMMVTTTTTMTRARTRTLT